MALSFRTLTSPDEDGLVLIEVRAHNETFAASGEVYSSPSQLLSLAGGLDGFPTQIPASVLFEAASGSCGVRVQVDTFGGLGQVVVKISIQESESPHSNSAVLWLKTEPLALVPFSKALRALAGQSGAIAELI